MVSKNVVLFKLKGIQRSFNESYEDFLYSKIRTAENHTNIRTNKLINMFMQLNSWINYVLLFILAMTGGSESGWIFDWLPESESYTLQTQTTQKYYLSHILSNVTHFYSLSKMKIEIKVEFVQSTVKLNLYSPHQSDDVVAVGMGPSRDLISDSL